MTKEERAEKVREGVYKRQLAKINPNVVRRIQNEYATLVQDSFERQYKVGKYASEKTNIDTKKPTYPTWEEIMQPLSNAMVLTHRGSMMTSKDDVKEHWYQAYHLLELAQERIRKAMTI